jgi:hypothetical protein
MNRSLPSSSLILFISLILASPAAADIAPDPLTAGTNLKTFKDEPTDVRMVWEDVRVKVSGGEISTVADFHMHNEGGTVTMEVGFPYVYEGNFIEFRAWVDGKEAEVREGKQENVGRKKVTVLWKLWDVTFEKGDSCGIRVEYTTKTFEFRMAFHWTDEYKSMPLEEIEKAETLTRQGTVSYWLDSGKGWKGVLDRCTVEFELADMTDANIFGFWPETGEFTGKGVIWEFTDYEPKSRVFLKYYPGMEVEKIPPFMLGILERYPNEPHLTRSVGSSLGGEFRRKELSREVYHSFLADWDGHVPQLMEYASGGRCRFDYKGAGGDFYTTWAIASILFREYEVEGTLERAADIASNVSMICTAIIDSLDTCANLPESNAKLYEDAVQLRQQANSLMSADK